ncbi:uncharacterized protein LOC110607964 [Manihot esculenta]|uniref:uncharacterized protein LOC110607964 n=1 Tax=Manihot esculenta TaxID=3983 RepID=UPI000B5D16FA|nr:uncharacterized protein LOC110607964 [Manihot esculenta]
MEGDELIFFEEKLDRKLTSRSWCNCFPDAKGSACRELIVKSWSNYSHLGLIDRLPFCAKVLLRWGSEFRQKYKRELADCLCSMRILRGSSAQEDIQMFHQAKSRYHELLYYREMHWQQRAKEFWLRDGDQNTRFFHIAAIAR